MADYLWSPVVVGVDEKGRQKVLPAGQKVTKADLKDADWDQLVEAGVIREQAYPDMPEGYQGSPIQYLQEQAAKAADVASAEAVLAEQKAEAQGAKP